MDRSDVTSRLVDEQTDRLLTTVASFTDDDVRGPSLCEGWSRAHVLTHLARNAEGIARAARAATSRSGETMYAGQSQRDADIEAGAGRSAAELAEDVRHTAAQLAPLLAQVHPRELPDVTFERTPGGEHVFAARLPFMRLREVVIHHVDLDAGFGFEDVDEAVGELFLRDAARRLEVAADAPGLRLETTTGDRVIVGDGRLTVRAPRAGMLRWLLRRDARDVTSDGPVPELPRGF
ncbi:MAG: maleylpyruvate isomerase family mycothiol-dependent enzyme [Intrasporangium sp.]|uniref:maleylpyruvate isomerase family mycothiol-dependent enzyme n=1 Tax=Intrasporangium sp. TaxID=1925024 RepID=UPI002648606A|nr:maleylpyruvate isomerase family mycothiol-dependent enzyme [Intrasporangium sp.]MDN5795200.1 maleylpyruvate isomerase family mycothiol-dependent enzyme [Intrasporangium sp.]